MSHAPASDPIRRFRRPLLAATGVVALAVATFGSAEVAGARPPLSAEVTAVASPTEATVGETITVTGTVTPGYIEVVGDDDPAVAGCGAVDGVSVAIDCFPTPTGDVAVLVDDVDAGTATLDGAGSYSWTTDELAVGTHEIVVIYDNEEYDEPGVSDPATVTITAPTPAPTGTYRDGSTSLSGTAGGSVVVTGSGWQADSQVTVTLRSEPVVLGAAGVGADGSFSQEYTIPASTPSGAHTITLDGTDADGEPASVVLSLQVSAATVAAAEQPPARDVPKSISFTG